jgi:hypothetical protein
LDDQQLESLKTTLRIEDEDQGEEIQALENEEDN